MTANMVVNRMNVFRELNRLAAPKTWNKIQQPYAERRTREGTAEQVIAAVAEEVQARVTLELSEEEKKKAVVVESNSSREVFWDVLFPMESDYIVVTPEEGLIRVATEEAAEAFWRVWIRKR